MAEITKVRTANREEWKALRSRYIGGSDAAAVVGMNAYVSPYSLWAEKTGSLPGFSGNLATEVGAYLEEFVARKFSEITGKKVRRANRAFSIVIIPGPCKSSTGKSSARTPGLRLKRRTR